MITRQLVALLLPALFLVVTACSGSSEPAEESASPTTSQAPAPTAPRTLLPDDAGSTSSAPPDGGDDAETTSAPGPDDPTQTAPPRHAFGSYGVAAGHPVAVQIGIDTLERGGNAVDASIAMAFAMGVIEPLTSGMGGGGAALVVPMPDSAAPGNPETALSYDYREVVQASGTVPRTGVGVPGFVAGMAELHEAHGQLPWRVLLQPSIDLARYGVPTSWWVAQEMRTGRGQEATADLPQFLNIAMTPLEENDLLVQPELAESLETVARRGRDGFYDGYLAGELTAVDGINRQSLSDYTVDVREPVSGQVGDHVVMSAAPALSGVALVQLLQVAEAHGLADTEPGSAAYVDTLSEAWLVAEESLETVVGDPNFVDVPIDELTDPRANAALEPGENRGGEASADRPADGNTTHLSVVDADGLSVSMTNTITDFWGSKQEIGGFFINSHLIRFQTTGRTAANRPEAGRRPVSYMAPAVVLDEEARPVLVIGSPGGQRIPTIEATVIARWLVHDQPLQSAVAAPRFHLDDGLLLVEELPRRTRDGLAALGYDLQEAPASWNLFGSVSALELDHRANTLTGAVDSRRTGAWDSGPGLRP